MRMLNLCLTDLIYSNTFTLVFIAFIRNPYCNIERVILIYKFLMPKLVFDFWAMGHKHNLK